MQNYKSTASTRQTGRVPAAAVALGALGVMCFAAGPLAAKEITIALSSEPTSMDPHFHNLSPNNSLARHMYDGLINPDHMQQLKPGLATSWKPVDDTTWEFKLREGVTFHDGTPFTADDVVCTMERAPNVEGSPSSFGTYIKGKTAVKVDDYTVHIKTAGAYPLMANDLMTFGIVSCLHGKDGNTESYNNGTAAIGTGPFKYAEYVPGDRIVLTRNDDYWGDKPEWTRVTFKPIKSSPSRVAALLAGDVDMIENVPTVDLEQLKKNDRLSISSGISNRVIYLHLDHDRDASPFVRSADGGEMTNPLKDLRVRQAISMAINRPAIVERVMENVAVEAGQLLPEGFFGVSDKLEPVKYDPKGAKALLAEAGYGDGFAIMLHGPNDRYVNDARIAEAIGQMLSRIGIKTEVVTMPRSVYFKRASRGGPDGTPEFSFVLVGWGAGSGEASSPLRSLLHTYDKERGFGASNRGRYSNPEVDALIEKAMVTVDDAERQAVLAEATEMAIGDVGIIPLHYQVNTWGARAGIKYRARTDEYTMAVDAYTE